EPEIIAPVTDPEPVTEVTEEPIAEPTDESPSVPSTFSLHFIDVGQADAALVECDGHYMLIDGGNKADSDVIYAVLKNAGVQKLDIVVGTHTHEDHVGGLPGAFNYTTADRTLCSVTSYDTDAFSDFKKYADQNGGGITVPAVGDEYSLGSALVKILGVNGGSDANNTSIVLKILYGETSFLFTDDAEREAEQTILNSGADLSATVLKVGHHGSDTSTTYPFLREIMPQYAVISVGTGNSYGHPTDDTLSRLCDADVQIYRTDLHGDIYLTSDGTTVTITTDKTATDDQILTSGEIIVTESEPEPVIQPEVSAGSMDYVLNTNSKKFHYPSCSSVKQMSEKNKAYYTGTRDEVIAMGYDPCGNCHP
ncbi:MAG: MBL fold metallo-hydrolase, partial [Clostridia bacterium]|nr:MBL fold metallo-hydrolase [Clostridia bacterium]